MIDETSTGIVIYNNKDSKNYFLLLHYPSGHWDFVKGKMEQNETTHQTAIRETKEETGIEKLEFVEGYEEKIQYEFRFEGELIHKEVIFFLASTISQKINLSHEHVNYIWLEYEQALKKITFQNAKDILSKANNLLE